MAIPEYEYGILSQDERLRFPGEDYIILSAPRIPPHQPKIHRLIGDASFRKFRRLGG